jgi:nitrate reductase NapE component
MNHLEAATETSFTSKWSVHLLLLAVLIVPVVSVALVPRGGDLFFLAWALPLVTAYAVVTTIAVSAVRTRRSSVIAHGVTLGLFALSMLVAGPR